MPNTILLKRVVSISFIALHFWFLVILFFFIFSIITCIEVRTPYHQRRSFVQDWIYVWKGILIRNTITFPFSIFVYVLHFSLRNTLVINARTPSIEDLIYVLKSKIASATVGEGTAWPSAVPEFTTRFLVRFVLLDL